MSLTKVQDLPPPGGYESITYKRVPPKEILKGMLNFNNTNYYINNE